MGVNRFDSYGFTTKTMDGGLSIALDFLQVVDIKYLCLQVRIYEVLPHPLYPPPPPTVQSNVAARPPNLYTVTG